VFAVFHQGNQIVNQEASNRPPGIFRPLSETFAFFGNFQKRAGDDSILAELVPVPYGPPAKLSTGVRNHHRTAMI
jgi:hypothetical protein